MRLAQELQQKIESWERAAAAGEAREAPKREHAGLRFFHRCLPAAMKSRSAANNEKVAPPRSHPLQHAVAPKTKKDTVDSASCIEEICTSQDLDREAETSETSEVMMCPALSPSLLWCCFGATKRYALLQHAVENGKHLMRHSHDGRFWVVLQFALANCNTTRFWPRRGDNC
jgi:hypothetical protein